MNTVKTTSLTLGRGEIWLGRLPERGVPTNRLGEIYIGNTPEFSTVRRIETMDAADSFDGERVAEEGVVVAEIHTARFTTDHISLENLALWYGAHEPERQVILGATRTETFIISPGRGYQLGRDGKNIDPRGIRKVTSVSFVGTPYTHLLPPPGVTLDLARGRFVVAPDSTWNFADGTSLRQVQFTYASQSRDHVKPSRKELIGSLRFISYNPVGEQTDYIYPKVSLRPSSEINLKGDSWQSIGFDTTALRLSPSVPYMYAERL